MMKGLIMKRFILNSVTNKTVENNSLGTEECICMSKLRLVLVRNALRWLNLSFALRFITVTVVSNSLSVWLLPCYIDVEKLVCPK